MILILPAMLLTVFLYLIHSLFSQFSFGEKLLTFFLCISANVVITLEIASLFSSLDQPYIVLLIQTLFDLITYLLLKKRIGSVTLTPFKDWVINACRILATSIKQHPFLSTYLSLIIVLYVFTFFLSITVPQNTADSLYNHLSRIGYWLQQGSLNPYVGFNNVGTTYPYNNSLLMLFSVIFLRSDVLVGSVQFFATIITAVTIYLLAIELGFPKRKAIFPALIYLTFPVVLLQSITAQNDSLTASFICISLFFLIRAVNSNRLIYLILSTLAFGLAIGTKQYAFFILPGLILLFILRLKGSTQIKTKMVGFFLGSLLLFTLTLGSYAYVQNQIHYKNLFGENDVITDMNLFKEPARIFEKIIINSSRSITQFISCDGLPQGINQKCIEIKATVFKPMFVNQKINIEDEIYLLEKETPFKLSANYTLNEESAGFGILGWTLIIPAIFYGLIYSIKNKRIDGVLLIFTAIIHFVISSFFKKGWDPYTGRYLISSVAILMPFTSFIFTQKKLPGRILVSIICAASIFISTYTIINNNSRPLIGKSQFYRTKYEDFSSIQLFAYKLLPLIENDKNIWGQSKSYVRTLSDLEYLIPLQLVDQHVPEDTTLGIIAKKGYFPDYLFFGRSFNRKIIPLFGSDLQAQPKTHDIKYLLIAPEFSNNEYPGFVQVASQDSWIILKRIE